MIGSAKGAKFWRCGEGGARPGPGQGLGWGGGVPRVGLQTRLELLGRGLQLSAAPAQGGSGQVGNRVSDSPPAHHITQRLASFQNRIPFPYPSTEQSTACGTRAVHPAHSRLVRGQGESKLMPSGVLQLLSRAAAHDNSSSSSNAYLVAGDVLYSRLYPPVGDGFKHRIAAFHALSGL